MSLHTPHNPESNGHGWQDAKAWLHRRMGRAFDLTVVGVDTVTPRMRRVSLIGEQLESLEWIPGQDLVLELPLPDGERARRHYTIRRFDPLEQRLDIDFVQHGAGASRDWLAAARIGERLAAYGPRGRTRLSANAGQHLFIGDETAIPAIFAMAETLPRGAEALALIEAEDQADAQSLATAADVTVEWRYRAGRPQAESRLNLDRLIDLGPSPYDTHAYVLGETSQVRAQRHALLAMGFDRDQITAEGYWRPGRIGGHDHV